MKQTTWQRILVQAVATPGYILLALGFLAVVNAVLYVFAVKAGVIADTAPWNAPDNTTTQFSSTIPSALLVFLFTGILWYFVGKMIHGFCVWLAGLSKKPVQTHRFITIGGACISWAIVAVVCKLLNVNAPLITASALAGVLACISFGLQQLTARIFDTPLVD